MYLRSKSNRGYYYYCTLHENYNATICPKKAVKQEDVESLALRLIQTQIRAFSDAQRLIANLNATPSSQTRYQIYETQIDDAKRKIEKFNQLKAALYGDFADGLLSHQDYTDLSEDYSRRADDLRIFIAELEKEKEKYSVGFGSKMQWALLIEKYKDQESLDAEMAAAFIETLTLFNDGHVEVAFRHRDEIEQVLYVAATRGKERRDMPDKVLAFYIRLSSEDRDLKTNALKNESNSVFNQRRLLQDYYDTHESLHGYKVIVFCDDGVTGTHFDRPKFDELIEMARNQEIHCIMVKDLSRFGRNFLEMGNYLELILPLYGVRFISINDAFDSDDYLGVTGGLELALRNLINNMYSRDLSTKVRSAFRTRNLRGEYWGGNGFYGYQVHPHNKKRLIVDEQVRDIIVMISSPALQA